LYRAEKGSEAPAGNRRGNVVDRSARVGLPRGDLSSFRPGVTATRPGRPDAARRKAADLCRALASGLTLVEASPARAAWGTGLTDQTEPWQSSNGPQFTLTPRRLASSPKRP